MEQTFEKSPQTPATPTKPNNQLDKSGQSDKSQHQLSRTKSFLFLALGLLFTILLFGAIMLVNKTSVLISSYADCLNAKGSLIQESYPSVCVTKSGQRFVQELTEEEKKNLLPPSEFENSGSSASEFDEEDETQLP